MKFLRALFVMALALAFVVPAFAETQNVKVSGSIDAYWFYRSNFDLRDGNDIGVVPAGTGNTYVHTSATGDIDQKSDADDYFRSNTQIEISADLTDNVSTVINLVNERDWNSNTFEVAAPSSSAGSSTAGSEFDITLDLAYVQMKEIFYSPLTLTIGRQDLWFGRGLVIGNNTRSWDPQGNTQANEYSPSTAFDAARATLDFNPWTLDFVYSKIDENSNNPEDDIDLYIANVNYKFAEYNAVAEAYYVGEMDRAFASTATASQEGNKTHTVGGRVQFDPISQITLGGELAYQMGNYRTSATTVERDREAWMFDIFGTYRWDYTWKPEITVEYVLFSGESDLGTSGDEGDYGAWNRLYRGKFYTAYADYREFVYGTANGVDQAAGQNEQFVQVRGGIRPLDDLLLEGSFTWLWTDEDVHTTAGTQTSPTLDDELGWEIDLQATYDYTEDVSFSTLVGWFNPGGFFAADSDGATDDTAATVVSSVKVTF